MNPNEVVCIYCGRKGARGFHAVHNRDAEYVDQWACDAPKACQLRQRWPRRMVDMKTPQSGRDVRP